FYLVCPKNHPLAKRKAAATLDDIADFPFINYVRYSSVRQSLDAAFGSRQINTVLEVEHLATISAMVERGIGISIAPSLTLYQ
ncbi:MAG: LysR substrate-binding domain-containing protein, partial [Pollutimonas bauzanensis]